jgi:hypothetical protein
MTTTQRHWLLILYANVILTIGLGLGRFLYTSMLPAMLEARWFSLSQGGLATAYNPCDSERIALHSLLGQASSS